MSRLLKVAMFAVAGIVALVVIGAILFTLLFDPNDFREQIAAKVKQSTGRDLVIEGDLDVSLFPWLAIDVGKTRLGNAPGFGDEPFASFEQARLSVRLLPVLLRREIQVGTAALNQLQLNLNVRRDGTKSWQDLLELSDAEPEAAETTSGRSATLDVSSIDVRDATITYSDAGKGETYRITNLSMTSGRVAGDDPVPLSGEFAFELQPMNLKGELDMETVATFDTAASTIRFDGLTIEGLIEGLAELPTTLAFDTPMIEMNTETQTMSVARVEGSIFGLDLTAEFEPFFYGGDIDANGTLQIDAFSPRSLMQRLNIEAPETADSNALGKAILDAKANVREESIDLSGLKLVLDDTTFTGSLSVPRSSRGTYRFDLAANSIDVNRYMAPPSEDSGGAAGDAESAPVEIPVDLIRPINMRGSLKLSEALLGGLKFENVVLSLNATNGKLRLHPVSATLFEGTYNGDVNINVAGDTPVISVDEKVSDVQLKPLAAAMFAQDNINGAISGAFKLTGRGDDLAKIQRSLGGNMSFELKDGAWEGTDIWYELRRARALLKGEAAPEARKPPRTEFSAVTATGVVTDGVFRNEDLLAQLPFMRLTGNGSVNMAEATVDYRLTARVLERPEFVTGATDAELDEFTEAVIPLTITGALASPKIAPDIGGMAKARVQQELESRKQELKDRVLGGLLGGKDEEEAAPADAGAAEPADAGTEPEPEEKKDLEDEVKDRLKGLFD